MPTFKDRLEEALAMRQMTAADLSKATKIGEGAISQYRKGAYKATQRNLEKISQALHVSIPWLMGITDDYSITLFTSSDSSSLPTNLTPLEEMDKIPLVGRIACGTPILAEENIEDYVDLPSHIHADFALECKGDSMINAGIYDGDIVYIKKQPFVENGQIAAVLLDGEEATLKRFYKNNDTVTLLPENTAYSPMTFVGEEINNLKIEGLAVAFTHKLV